MNISVFAYTRQGMKTAQKIVSGLPEHEIHLFAAKRIADEPFAPVPSPSGSFYMERFDSSDALLFVSACGIAVRMIAPFIRSKQTDPAVVCIDELGRYVIPILSGHIGGANKLAEKIASKLGAQPVITTATDINNRFSVDSWAVLQGFAIDNLQAVKAVSAAILEQSVPICSQLPLPEKLPIRLTPGETGSIGIHIGWEKREPFTITLRVIPKNLYVGIGCRKGTSADEIRDAVNTVVDRNNIDQRALKALTSIELKADEPGLLKYARKSGLPLYFFSAEELQEVPGQFAHSDFVEKITGVDNVCERAAMIRADQLIVPKTAVGNVTVAIAAEISEVQFG
ncbi:MAG: cobalt-precorrin 5A hydrolase [Anaerolineaceae bacterium]|nr:cobalt-precorrin 5A hydrolase [Anaerolineaceae bacterium]